MPYLLLAAAIAFEVVATTFLKLSDGFTRLGPSVVVVVGYGAAFALLALALRGLDLGFAYAVWAGVGTALVALVGVAVFGDALGAARIAGILLIVSGVVVLNLGGAQG